MINLNLVEAKLFRVLASLFGEDRVIPHMRVFAVCGGSIKGGDSGQEDWAKKHKCLFTIVDSKDTPKAVVEFAPDSRDDFIIAEQVEHAKVLPDLLLKHGIHYVTFSIDEFEYVLDPDTEKDIYDLMHSKLNVSLLSE